jgi:hypothetical protein
MYAYRALVGAPSPFKAKATLPPRMGVEDNVSIDAQAVLRV